MSRIQFHPRSLLPLALLSLPSLASADVLNLTQSGTIDITALNIQSVGDLSFSDGRIWISDGATLGKVFAVNTNGLLLNTLLPDQIAGIDLGPDAITTFAATGLIMFSAFGESVGVRLNWTTSVVNATYPSGYSATGAEQISAFVWVASCPTVGGGATLLQLDSVTGDVLQTIPIPGITARIADLAFDPVSGSLYALFEDSQLRELDTTTGAVLSTLDFSPFTLADNTLAAGIDFDSFGTKLYVCSGSGAGTASDTIVVLDRVFSTNVCGSGLPGAAYPCPCTQGAIGRGCVNSVTFNLGGFLGSTGASRSSNDSFVLGASGMPPGTFVLFFQGTDLTQPGTPFGDGILCAGGSIARLAIKAAPSGSALYPEGSETKIHVLGAIPPSNAGTRVYQGWYRDSANFCTASTFNLTNAIAAEWFP